MDIMTGLTAAANALKIVKDLRELEKGFNEAEFKLKIAELYASLADVKMSLADAKAEVESKQDQLDALLAQFKIRTDTVMHQGYKYERGSNGSPVGFPFCPNCEADGKMVRTTYTGKEHGEAGCPRCKAVYRYPEEFPYPNERAEI